MGAAASVFVGDLTLLSDFGIFPSLLFVYADHKSINKKKEEESLKEIKISRFGAEF